jgi:hypothetical protein
VPLHVTSSLGYRVLEKLIISAFYWAPYNETHTGSISGLNAWTAEVVPLGKQKPISCHEDVLGPHKFCT